MNDEKINNWFEKNIPSDRRKKAIKEFKELIKTQDLNLYLLESELDTIQKNINNSKRLIQELNNKNL